jgi:hypothetical protein
MSLPPGRMLGPYEILSPIGEGGMDSPRLCQEKSSYYLNFARVT